MNALDDLDMARFERDGYLIVKGLMDEATCHVMREHVERMLEPLQAPAEFEAEVGYVGSPRSRLAAGGNTPRRLLHAFTRDAVFAEWATGAPLGRHLRRMLGTAHVSMSQCHHNCVMTKMPGFSSETLWHQDIRYWSFDQPELVSVWLPLGPERASNGGLMIIPGSHRIELDRGRLDASLFLRRDLEDNVALIDSAVAVELDAGDVLFFHCRVFHAAGMNRADATKLSVVFTYHADDNGAIPGTRSAVYPSIPVS
jgi:phytanoyl-CoA hydroxylase